MIYLMIGIAIIIAVTITVKLFDKEIRPVTWRKALVNAITLTGLILIIVGIIFLIIY